MKGRSNTRQNHLKLARQIVDYALESGLGAGDHLPEMQLSGACGVSRTPIRSALKILEANDIVTKREEEGYFLRITPEAAVADGVAQLEELEGSLASRILKDRAERRISDVQSVSALARRYGAPRASVLSALKILNTDGIVSQLPGRAWAFQPILDTPNALLDSLSFRLILEPQAIATPGFAMDSQKAGTMRQQMEDLLARKEDDLGSAAFLRLDCAFHSLIAEGSGNRFLRGTLLAHHRLRSTTQKDHAISAYRLRQSLREHLDILDSLERAQHQLAADQMVLHLRRAQIRRPQAANRGIHPLAQSAAR